MTYQFAQRGCYDNERSRFLDDYVFLSNPKIEKSSTVAAKNINQYNHHVDDYSSGQ